MSREYSYRFPVESRESEQERIQKYFKDKIKKTNAKQNRTDFCLALLLATFLIGYFMITRSINKLSNELADYKLEVLEGDKIYKEKIEEHANGMIELKDVVLSEVEETNKILDKLDKSITEQNKKIDSLQKFFKSPYKEYPKNVKIAQALIDRGFSKEGASAIVGNIAAESDFKTNASDGQAVGLMQWQDGRLDRLKAFAKKQGRSYLNESVQLDYIAWELRGGNKKETKNFNKAKKLAKGNVKQFAYHVAKHVERPADWALEQSKNKRMNVAMNTYNELNKIS